MADNLRIYLRFINNSIQKYIAYKVNIFIEIITKIFKIFLQIFIWKVLFEFLIDHGGLENSNINSMTLYVVVSAILSVLMPIYLFTNISAKVQDGSIAIDLMRPISFAKYIISDYLGAAISQFVIQIIPISIIIAIFFDIDLPSVKYLLLFLWATLNAVIINILINFIIGYSSFWIIQIWPIGSLYESCIRILSGSWIPLWLFPGFLQNISKYLPFESIFYVPLSIFLQSFSISNSMQLIGRQIIWIVILYLIQLLLWKKGTNKLVIQGG